MQLNLFSIVEAKAPYEVVEKRQYINEKWDEHYCLRFYSELGVFPNLSDCKKVFESTLEAEQYAKDHHLEFRKREFKR